MSGSEIEGHDLTWHLEQAIQELDLTPVELAHNMAKATEEQLHEIVSFAERLKKAALIEMYGRERATSGRDARHLVEPPPGGARLQG